MRKLIFSLILFLYSNIGFAQKQCSCELYPDLKELISCKDLVFKNRAKLYWRFNCNKAWLTFKNPQGKKSIIFSLDSGLVTLQGRLGYVGFTEYPSFFLAQNNVISGCCQPSEFYLHNKTTGKVRSELGPLIYFSKKYDTPVVIYTNNNSLIFLNVETRKKHVIKLPRGSIEQGLRRKNTRYPENLFTVEDRKERLLINFDCKNDKKSITHFDVNLKEY